MLRKCYLTAKNVSLPERSNKTLKEVRLNSSNACVLRVRCLCEQQPLAITPISLDGEGKMEVVSWRREGRVLQCLVFHSHC